MNDHHANGSPIGSVLAIRPFRTLRAAQICSQMGFAMLLFVLALRVYQVTGSNTAVSGLFLTFGVPAVVGGIGMLPIVVTGFLADVIGVGKVIFALGVIITIYGVWRMRYNKA